MLEQKEINKLDSWARKLLKDDFDKFDLHSEIDRGISVAENKTILREKFKVLFKELKEINAQEIKTEQQKDEFKQIQKLRAEEQQALRVFETEVYRLKKSTAEVTQKYHIPIEYIKSVARGFNNAFIFLGSCGLGKSYITRQTLAKEGVKFIESRGVNSPLGFYQFLYEHNEKDTVLVFDDVAQLIDNPNAYSILLGVLWEGLASWNSTTGKLKIPKQFVFHGRIIIIANRLKGELKDFFDYSNADVVKSRCLTSRLEMDREDVLEMMYLIAKQKRKELTAEERVAIVDFIKEHTSRATEGLDLRTQVKAEQLYLYDKENWKALVLPLLVKNDILEVLEDCIRQSNSIQQAQHLFTTETGLKRSTFFKLKQKVQKSALKPI